MGHSCSIHQEQRLPNLFFHWAADSEGNLNASHQILYDKKYIKKQREG